MNAFDTAATAGLAASGGLAGSPLPFAATSCRCHAAAAEGRDLVDVPSRATVSAADGMRSAVAAADRIDWEGPAATMFRQRLATLTPRAVALASAAGETARLARTEATT